MSAEVQNTSARNATNATFSIDINALKQLYYALYLTIIVVGTALNLWMIASMLTSPEIRSRLRNKMICVLLLNNLLKTSIVSAAELTLIALMFETKQRVSCTLWSFNLVVRYTSMWIENWYFLILLAVYVTILLDFDLMKRYPPIVVRVGTPAVVVGPWIFSIIVAPSVIVYHSHSKYGIKSSGCVNMTRASYHALLLFGITIPFFFKLIMAVVIPVARFFRKSREREMTASLIEGRAQDMDNITAYMTSCIVCLLTEAPFASGYVIRYSMTPLQSFIFSHIAWYLMEAQALLLPPCFVFLEDIRHRLKSWRPWYRPGPGIDLTVQYQNKAA